MLHIVDHPTSKHGPDPITPVAIVLHDTEGDLAGGLYWLADAPKAEASVSIHYLIAPDGTIFRIVRETQRAWHAGTAHDYGNWNSIGIELSHRSGHPYPAAQLKALEELILDIASRWRIEAVVGHKDICLPPGRKTDPQLNPQDYSLAAIRARRGEEVDMTKDEVIALIRAEIEAAYLPADQVQQAEQELMAAGIITQSHPAAKAASIGYLNLTLARLLRRLSKS